jgi:TrmH family RNA methyltransferase
MKDAETITSLGNPLVKRIRRLQEKSRARDKENAFFVEGVPLTLEAFAAKAPVESIVFSDALLREERGRTELARQRARGTRCVSVSDKVFRGLSQRNNPDGLAAVCRTTWRDLDRVAVRPSDVFVAADCLSDPGNLGTILRTMDCTRSAGLILIGKSTNPFHPRTVRASRGTIFTVPLYRSPDVATVFGWAAARGVGAVATSAKASDSFWEAALEAPLLCLFGNENRGLDAETMAAADRLVGIPMSGRPSSLNVAVAVSLVLYEIERRKLG